MSRWRTQMRAFTYVLHLEKQMNVLNMIPVVGWIIAAFVCLFVAIPVYFLWNWLAPIYFYQLPSVYLTLPFWHVFGLLWLISSLKGLLLPTFSSSSSATTKSE
jgi:polyferredoxin